MADRGAIGCMLESRCKAPLSLDGYVFMGWSKAEYSPDASRGDCKQMHV
jgi:hypothetical protein